MEILFCKAGCLQEMTEQTRLKALIAMNRDGNPDFGLRLSINVMTALDAH